MRIDTYWSEPLPGACIVQSHQWKTTAGRRREEEEEEEEE
jgi:hypothetical protein